MNKTQTVTTIVIMTVVVILAFAGAYFGASLGFSSKEAKIKSEISKVKTKNNEIRSSQDSSGFVPIQFVKAFMDEVKSDNTANAKLYLSAKVQSMDVKNTLKLGKDLANMIIGDATFSINGDDATVTMNFQVGSDQASRQFNLIKESGNWKVNGITAE